MLNIVSFSGGKDSTCMLLMMLERGMQVDYIICCDTGMEFPEMYEHWKKVDDYISTNYGKHITYLKADKSFEYYFKDYTRVKGKHTDIKGYGWPSMFRRWCTEKLKLSPIKQWKKTQTEKINECIGIAFDEQDRMKKGTIYPLIVWEMTEKNCLDYCYSKGFNWQGLYEKRKRVSCWICPLQGIKGWRLVRKQYPKLWKKALQLDKTSDFKLSESYTLNDLDHRFAVEDLQTVLNF